MTLLKQNKLLSVIIGIFVLILVYYIFFTDKSSVTPGVSSSDTPSAVVQSQQLLLVLANLRTIQLNNAIFQDPVYLSLTDFGVSIPPQEVARHNPFAPTNGHASESASSSALVSPRTLQRQAH